MVQSTIDKIKDTTIYRTIRKLAGVVDEQNETVQTLQDAIDNFDLDGVKTDVNKLKVNDAKQDTEITALTTNVDTLNDETETLRTDVTLNSESIVKNTKRIDGHDDQIFNLREKDTALENAMPKTYTLYRDGEGKIKAQVETIDGTLMNSNTLDMIIPYQYDIVSGTTNRSFKLNITMSDGSSYTTNDFVIPEGGGTDITVTGITLSKDSTNVNRFHVGINLSDGSMIDSGFITIVDSVSGTFSDNKLVITVNGVSSVPIGIDTLQATTLDFSKNNLSQFTPSDISSNGSINDLPLSPSLFVKKIISINNNQNAIIYCPQSYDITESFGYFIILTDTYRNKLANILIGDNVLNNGNYEITYVMYSNAFVDNIAYANGIGRVIVSIIDGEIIQARKPSNVEYEIECVQSSFSEGEIVYEYCTVINIGPE